MQAFYWICHLESDFFELFKCEIERVLLWYIVQILDPSIQLQPNKIKILGVKVPTLSDHAFHTEPTWDLKHYYSNI